MRVFSSLVTIATMGTTQYTTSRIMKVAGSNPRRNHPPFYDLRHHHQHQFWIERTETSYKNSYYFSSLLSLWRCLSPVLSPMHVYISTSYVRLSAEIKRATYRQVQFFYEWTVWIFYNRRRSCPCWPARLSSLLFFFLYFVSVYTRPAPHRFACALWRCHMRASELCGQPRPFSRLSFCCFCIQAEISRPREIYPLSPVKANEQSNITLQTRPYYMSCAIGQKLCLRDDTDFLFFAVVTVS